MCVCNPLLELNCKEVIAEGVELLDKGGFTDSMAASIARSNPVMAALFSSRRVFSSCMLGFGVEIVNDTDGAGFVNGVEKKLAIEPDGRGGGGGSLEEGMGPVPGLVGPIADEDKNMCVCEVCCLVVMG